MSPAGFAAMWRHQLRALTFLCLGTLADGFEYQKNLGAAREKHDSEVQKIQQQTQKECANGSCDADNRAAQSLLAFNIAVSDRVPYSRDLPDYRYKSCVAKEPELKPAGTVSVILVFFNEGTSTLLRTAQSVLDRTNPELLTEILLVSDGVTIGPWRKKQDQQIKDYCAKNPKVKHVALPDHLGLAPAKAEGAKHATGDLLVFLDSHCEVGQGWLEPMADAVARDRRTVAIPIIDGIDSDSFHYRPGAHPTRGVFTWGMYYAGEPYSDAETAQLAAGNAVPMPIMPGGLFLVERKWFEELGFYDEGLRIWGAENIELSLKVWRCGGRVELIPCSRIGHVYKAVNHMFPRGESLQKNFKRIAEVWLDEYKDFYYNSFPRSKGLPSGDLAQALAAKSKLECKSMDWFLKTVYPTMFVPKNNSGQGFLEHASGKLGCVDLQGVALASNPMQHPHVSEVAVGHCEVNSDYNQWYHMRDTERVVHIGIWIEECLGLKMEAGHADRKSIPVVACQCAKYGRGGCTKEEIRWEHSSDGRLRHLATGRCLMAAKSGKVVAIKNCAGDKMDRTIWRFRDRWGGAQPARDEL